MNLVVVVVLVLGIGAFLVVKHRRRRWALLYWLPIATFILVCGSGAFLQFHVSQGGHISGMDGAAQATFDLLIWIARILVALGVVVLVLAFPRGAGVYAGVPITIAWLLVCISAYAVYVYINQVDVSVRLSTQDGQPFALRQLKVEGVRTWPVFSGLNAFTKEIVTRGSGDVEVKVPKFDDLILSVEISCAETRRMESVQFRISRYEGVYKIGTDSHCYRRPPYFWVDRKDENLDITWRGETKRIAASIKLPPMQ